MPARKTLRGPARPTARRRRTPGPRRSAPRPRGRGARATEPPRFSLRHLDRSVDPRQDFYRYAAGSWIRTHPVPADKARWGGFGELAERNYALVHRILEEAARDKKAPKGSVPRQVGDLYRSSMDLRRVERLKFRPIEGDLAKIAALGSIDALVELVAEFHRVGIGPLFDPFVMPDRKDSRIYAFYLWQGGISLPDREYYLSEAFARIRAQYLEHVARLFRALGERPAEAKRSAATVLELETALARAGRSQTELRDSWKNYNRTTPTELGASCPNARWAAYLARRGVPALEYLVVGQPEFFAAMDRLLLERPLEDWKTYLRWTVLHAAAPHLHGPVEREDFRFFHQVLLGQRRPEPRWRRAVREIDFALGEALGQLYVERHFPPEARRRMGELVDDLRAVFRQRLEGLAWMGAETRQRALEKFDRFTAKIGHPERYRDYSSVAIDPADLLGNLRRAAAFEVQRQLARVGGPVDRNEWQMTPPTVNAYFDASRNEIFFPAGILQPPFFDLALDDAVNYGAIGAVIGHEITHGYDDQGRQFDADGNLHDWWTAKDAEEFTTRARRIIEEYDAFEPLPGLHVNGELTQGENIADFGGISIAFDALQRRLAQDPARRRPVEGLSPEQRFFLSYAQMWRENVREPEIRRRITVDPHSPARFRANGPLACFPPFLEAFGVRPGDGMWLAPERRGAIW